MTQAPNPYEPDAPAHAARSSPFVRRLLDNLPGMAYRCRNDQRWTMEFASGGASGLTGLAPRALVGDDAVPYRSLIHPEDRERVWRDIRRSLAEQRPFQITYRIRRADGEVRWVWEQGVGVVGRSGRTEAIEGFVTDVSDRVDLAHNSEHGEIERQALIERSLAGLYILRDGRLEHVNERYAEIFGYTVEELLALESITSLIHRDDRMRVTSNIHKQMSGEADAILYEARCVRKDGTRCDVEVHGRRVETDHGPAIIGVLLDVTDRKREELRHEEARKLAAMGKFAESVAHDFRNVLAVIKTAAQLAAVEHPDDPPLARDLADILETVDRGTELSRRLMKLGRPEDARPRRVSVSQVVDDAVSTLERTASPDVEISWSLDAELPLVRIDPAHVEEIATSLVSNAGDAMPDGGTITVRTYVQPTGADEGRPSGPPVPHVVLEVTDTGHGIPEPNRTQIFDPYFTTKQGEGAGLGLANVRRMAWDAGGEVTVESQPEVGTTVRVFLPTTADDGPGWH